MGIKTCVFYKTTICPRRLLLSGPRSGCLIQIQLYLKINCKLSAKSKLNCRRLSTKLPKNTRHSMVEKSESLFNEAIAMKCQKLSSGCSVKKIFWKFLQNSQENTCTGVSLIWHYRDSSAGVFLWISQNDKFVEHLRTVTSEMLHD